MQFIKLLEQALSKEGHTIQYSTGDADTLIVSTALKLAGSGKKTTVVADDADILVILLHHWNNEMADIFLHSEAKKKENIVPLYSIKDISASLGENMKSLILFVHAWTGCDTTSAIYGQGKLVY